MTDDTTPGREAETDGGYASGGLPETAQDDETEEEHGLPPLSSIKRWFVTTNHKDIGILYIVTSIAFLLFGGALALLFRLQLLSPRLPTEGIISATAYNQAVSGHGMLMVFWFLSPIAVGFANYLVPLQIGAKDLAFPRLNALSYWLYLASGILFGLSFFLGGTFEGGWTMYGPLNQPTYTPGIGSTLALLALTLFTVSVTVGSVNFLTTIHRMRAEGMTLRNMPVFTWAMLLTVWMMLFAFAALLAAMMILSADRLLGTNFYSFTEGGSLLWTHLWWFFGHPEVYIVFFPALGAMAEIFQTFTGKRLVGRKWFIASMVLVAIQSFVVWMHHMFLTSINLQVKTLFMATTIGISLPFDLMVFSLIYTTLKGRIKFTTPFLFAFGSLILFIVGGITGVFLGAVVLDYEFRGTYWVVAHFHYVMLGGATALFGGLYYWFPKFTGRMYDEFLGKIHFAAYFVGFNLLYFPQFIAWETPRRVFNYQADLAIWHQLSTVGGFVLGLSFLVMFYNFGKSIRGGPEVDGNPWEYATTAEWAVPSPPPLENFPGIPSYASGALEFLDDDDAESKAAAADGGAVVEGHGGGHEEEHASHASIWPFAISASSLVFVFGLSGLSGASWPSGTEGLIYQGASVLGGVGLLVTLVAMGKERFHAPEPALAERWPFSGVENTKLGLWIFLASDVLLFGAFIGTYLFARVAVGWSEWHIVPHTSIPGLMNTYILLTSSFAVVLALVAAEKGSRKGVLASLVSTLLLGIAFLINKGIEWIELFHEGEWLSTSIETATFFLTTGLHGAHVIAGLVITIYLIWRAWGGAYLDDERPLEYFGLYWHFVDIVWLFLFPLFYIL
jgi:cytochrome c oxidase subunit I+III